MSTLATTNLKHASSASNNIVLASDGTTTIAAPSNIIKSGTAVASTAGTAIDFTGIPSWVKRITVLFDGVSTNGVSEVVLVQLGTSSGFNVSGYFTQVGFITATTYGRATYTTGVGTAISGTSATRAGSITFTLKDGNNWIYSGIIADTANVVIAHLAGSKTTSGTVDRLRITTTGTDTFDAGSINILYEG